MNFTKYIWCLLSLLVFEQSHSQDFEGRIEYRFKYILKNDKYTEEFLRDTFGSKVTVYRKNGFHKEKGDGKFMSEQIYRYPESRIYYMNSTSRDTLYSQSTLMPEQVAYKAEIVKNVDTLLGKICNKLIYEDKYGTKEIFFSPDYSVNPDFYENYQYANNNIIVGLTQSVELKLTTDMPDFIVEIIAVEIEEIQLDDSFFKLPDYKVLIEEN